MTNNKKIEKDLWKFCKEIFENRKKALPNFDEKSCSDCFTKSLKKNKHLRDFSPPSWMKSLDEPDSSFGTIPPNYREISKIIHKMILSDSTCPFEHVSATALKTCSVLRSVLHRIINYCWTKKVIPVTWRKDSACLYTIKVH